MWYVRTEDRMKEHGYIKIGPDFKHEYYNYGPGMPPPGPENWLMSSPLSLIPFGGAILIEGPGPAGSYVVSPNWLERLLGITLDNKLEKAIRKCQRWCDKQNKKGEKGPYGYEFKLEREAKQKAGVL